MPNYGQFTGYEPLQDLPGAFSFKTADGKSMTAGGQAALDLKARLDAANAATQTAGDKAAGGFQISGLGGKLHEQGVDAGKQTLAELGGQAPPPGAAPPGAPPPPAGGPEAFSVNGINTGYIKGPDGRLYEQTPGTAGVSKTQLEKKATQGTELPTGASQSTSGGFDPNQEYLDARRAGTEQTKNVANEARDAEITAQEQGRAVAGEQFVAQTAAVEHQKELVDKVQAGVDGQQLIRDQALKEYTGTKVDPDRVFAGGAGFAKRLGAALAAGIGAYGAAINHTQNFAGQIIDNMIERDIHAQEVDLRTKKDASDSALGDLMRKGMTLDQAKNTLTTIQKDWARQQLELAKGASGSDAINAKYDAHIAKLTQDQLDNDEKYRQDSLGKVTKAVQSQVVYPQAATAGGVRAVAPGKALGIAGSTAGVEGQVAGTAKTLGELEGGRPGGGKADPKALAALATADVALKSLSAYGDDDIPSTLGNQDIASSTYHRAKDLVLGNGASARGMSERDRSLIQDTEAAKGYVKSLTSVLSGQGALSGSEAQAAELGMSPSATVGDLKRAVAVLKARAQAVVESGGTVAAPGGAEAVSAYTEQLAKMNPVSGASQLLGRVRSEQAQARAAQAPANDPDSLASIDAGRAAKDAEQSALEADNSKIDTVVTQTGRGFLDAITAPGALVGMAAEGAGAVFGSEGLEGFGRDLGNASSGKSAMEAAAFLFGGGGKHGLTTAERVSQASADQQKAWPALSTISHVAGMAAPALIGGGLASGGRAAANIGLGAAEGAASGAQMGYERNEALRDVVSSALVGGALGAGAAGIGEGLSGLLKSKAYKAAARELVEDANLSAAGVSRGNLASVAGDGAGAVDAKASELAGALQDYRFQTGPLEGKPIVRMLRTPEGIAEGVQQAAKETSETLQAARTAALDLTAEMPNGAPVAYRLRKLLEGSSKPARAGEIDDLARQAIEATGGDAAAYDALVKQTSTFSESESLLKTSTSTADDAGSALGTISAVSSLAKGASAPGAMAAGFLTKVAQKAVQQRAASTVAALANTMVVDTVSSALEHIIPSVETAASSAAGGKGAAAMPANEREFPKRPEPLTPEKQQDRHREQLDKVNEAVAAPDIEARTELIDKVGHLPTPLVIAAGADMSAKMAQLHADMPKPTPNLRGKAYETMSSEQVRLANSMYEATTDPMSVFSDFAAGTVDYAKVKYAWKQYPGLQQAAQAGLMDILSQRLDDKARGAIPDGLLTQLDNLFGFEGKLQPTLDSRLLGSDEPTAQATGEQPSA